MPVDPQQFLRELFATAIDAAHPQHVLEAHLPSDRSGRVIVIGAGKAAAAMAQVVERCWLGEVSGLVVTRYGHGAPCEKKSKWSKPLIPYPMPLAWPWPSVCWNWSATCRNRTG